MAFDFPFSIQMCLTLSCETGAHLRLITPRATWLHTEEVKCSITYVFMSLDVF